MPGMITPRLILYAIIALVLAGAVFLIYDAGRDKAVLEAELKAQRAYALAITAAKEAVEENLRTVNAANQAHAERAARDQLILDRLQELADDTPENAAACLDADAARRVRNVR